MSPEVAHPKELNPSEIYSILTENYICTELQSKKVHQIDPLIEERQEMAACTNEVDGVDQNLRAIIKAGNDYFGVVDFLVIDEPKSKKANYIESTAITHHQPGRRAELVCIINKGESPITIGRNINPNLDDTVSREHFKVSQASDGAIGIIDNDSTNGTKVFEPSDKFGLLSNTDKDSGNPIQDIDFWSVKSIRLKNVAKARAGLS